MNVRGVDASVAVMPDRPNDKTLPEAGRLITALRQIGYSLEQSLADLVDNSVNAGASTVVIRFMHDGDQVKAVAVADDGYGMSAPELQQAMRFGTIQAPDPSSLGKFGMGLKLASLSYAKSLTVYSRRYGRASARRWTIDGITRGWWCQRLKSPVPAKMLDRPWANLDLSENGTVILWEDIDKLPSHQSGLRATLSLLERRLRLHLGLCFHRFLEAGKLKILIDQCLVDRGGQNLSANIRALNPFAYPKSGNANYPKTFRCKLIGTGVLNIQAHIWPAKSESPEYRLGKRTSSRQGFYFYRNGRLIQAGGWNGLVQDESEPHSSLARVEIDLPPKFDHAFGINVQKSTVIVPPGYVEAVQTAVSSDGVSFEAYRRDAQSVYRSAVGSINGFQAIPTNGIHKQLTRKFTEQLNGTKKTLTPVEFRWVKLTQDELFRINHNDAEIQLNSDYRIQLLGDRRGNLTDVPVLKLLLFHLMRRDLEQRSSSDARQRELKRLNEILAEAVRLM